MRAGNLKSMMNDKRIRQLVVAVLVVILALGLLSLVSTIFQLIVPLALVIGGGFAFYKVVLEGRDAPETMDDELAESSGMAAGDLVIDAAVQNDSEAIDEDESEARQRLSAVERAKREFLEAATPAEEIIEQLKSRTQRLQGDDDE